MPDPGFAIKGVEVVRHAATPLLNFRLQVREDQHAGEVANIMLRCQIQIEAARRRYDADEQSGLQELFGEAGRWDRTLHALLWTHVGVLVPAFAGECTVELPVPCSYDFNLVATKYFHALKQGVIPLCFQFSGTVFYRDDGVLQLSQIPWTRDARFALPVAVWQQMMDHYYPNSAWLRLDRALFNRLQQYKLRLGLPSFERALERALDATEEKIL